MHFWPHRHFLHTSRVNRASFPQTHPRIASNLPSVIFWPDNEGDMASENKTKNCQCMKYLPDDVPALEYEGHPITLLTLANHSSGIPRMPNNFHPKNPADPYIDYTDNDLFDFLKV